MHYNSHGVIEMKRILAFAVGLSLCTMASINCAKSKQVPTKANGIEFHKESFSITVPDNWVEIPREIIDAYEAKLTYMAPNVPSQHFDYGFQPSDNGWMQHPYMLVQIKNTGRISKSELQSIVSYSPQAGIDTIDFGSMLTNVEAGKPIYDKETNIIWAKGGATVAGTGAVVGLWGMLPTETGFILTTGSAKAKDFSEMSVVFKSIITSITPTSNLVYKKKWSEYLPSYLTSGKTWGRIIASLIKWGLIVGIFSLVGFLSSKMKKKRKIGDDEKAVAEVKSTVTVLPGNSVEDNFARNPKIPEKPLKFICSICGKLIVSSYCKKGENILCRHCNNRVRIPDDAVEVE